MKKVFLSFLFGAAISTQVIAQDDDKIVSLGVKGVVSGSWIGSLPQSVADVTANKENMQIGFSGGLWLRLRMPITGFFIQPELNITQQNGKYSYQIVPNSNSSSTPPAGSVYNDSRAISLTNLELPISLGYKIPLGPIGVRANFGGILSGILSAKEVYTQQIVTGGIAAVETSVKQDVKDKINAFQAGLQGGIGLDFGSRISLDVRLQQNLTKLYEDQSNTVTRSNIDQSNQKVVSGQVIIGFRLF